MYTTYFGAVQEPPAIVGMTCGNKPAWRQGEHIAENTARDTSRQAYGVAMAQDTTTIHCKEPLCDPRPRVEYRTAVAPGFNKQKTASNLSLLPTMRGKPTSHKLSMKIVYRATNYARIECSITIPLKSKHW
jgi:hypothetical protein